MAKRCKAKCGETATEASGYCFSCAEELAVMLEAEGMDPRTAWGPVVKECQGHPAGPFDPMGVTVYCDGSCRRGR